MERPDLAQLEHENMIEAISLLGSSTPDGVVRRGDGVALILSGLPILLANQVMVASDRADEGSIADAVAEARRFGVRFVVNLRIGTDDRWIGLMDRLGLTQLSPRPWMPGMALHPIAAGMPPVAAGHEIRAIVDAAGLEDVIQASAAGFEMPESIARRMLGPAMVERPDVTPYAGYTDGQAVSVGVGVRTGRTMGVYSVSTIPAFRRRGYGAAITARITSDGAAAGCDVAVLQASDMGYPVYERLGYRTVVEYMAYVEPE